MALNKLTLKQVKTLGDGFHSDGGNLYLRVVGNGRSWIFRYRCNYKSHDIGLGSAYTVPLSKAREIAADYRLKIALGEVPNKDRVVAKKEMAKELKLRTERYFKDFYADAIEHYVKIKRLRGRGALQNRLSAFRMYALPYLGDKSVRTADAEDITEALKPIWDTHPATALQTLNTMRMCFSYAAMKGWFKGTPPTTWKGGLEMFLPPPNPQNKHHTALPWTEIPKFAQWLVDSDPAGRGSCVRDLLIVTLLCATRVGEFSRMRSCDIDVNKKVAYVRHRKDGKQAPFIVPYPRQAEPYFIEASKRNELSFPTGTGKIIDSCGTKFFLSRSPFTTTIHGFRASFSTWCADNGKDPVIREMCLCHQVESTVALAYQRSDRLEERRKLLQEWADYLLPEG